MAVEKSALRVTELDFTSIRENLKTYLRSQSEFQDFDFEGSGMAILLDILAYNTHYMGYYLNMIGNEMFLDTAQIRASVLSHAKSIGYVPASRKGSLSKVNIVATPSEVEDQNANIITLEKYTRLLGASKDGVNYPFVTLYSNTATKSNGTFSFANVYIKQGEVLTQQYLMESGNESRRFEIPSANVDLDTVVITVQESSSNTDTSVYVKYEDITELTSDSKVFFIEENENLNYTFYFGDDVLGKKPKPGNIIICTYLDTVGSVTNNISKFTFVEPVGGLYSDNVTVTSVGSSYGGVDKETIDQARFRAPYFYTAQNRAINESDYKTLLLKDYNYIDSISVWGGEDHDPVIYGKVFMSIKTKGNYILTNFEKENIKKSLIKTRNIMTVTPEIVEPDYAYLQTKGKVIYDSKVTNLTSSQLLGYVKAAISDYAEEELNAFTSTFKKSVLQTYIEESEKSITASDLDIFVQKRIKIDTNNTKTYTINFNMPISKAKDVNKLTTFPELTVYDLNNVARNVFFEITPSVDSGIQNISIVNAGRNYLTAPNVQIVGDGTGATAVAKVLSGRIISIDVINPGTDYSSAAVVITSEDGAGGTAIAELQSNHGILRSYYYTSNGSKVFVNRAAGTVDYTTGQIVLNNLRAFDVLENDWYDDNYLTITVPIDEEIINPLRNRILTVDENDPRSYQIQMVAS